MLSCIRVLVRWNSVMSADMNYTKSILPFLGRRVEKAIRRLRELMIWSIFRPAFILMVCFFGLNSEKASAEYLLQPGDVLELIVAGVPELRQRSVVGIDGDVSFTLVGEKRAVGQTVADLRSKVLSDLSSKVFQQRTTDGRDVAHLIMQEEIGLTIVEYRSIYLNGDVARPGEQSFKPGLTIRQAVAVAGGYDLVRFRMNNPLLESADLRAEYESLWMDYAREQAHRWRLNTELGQSAGPEPGALKVPVSPELMENVALTERDHLKTRLAQFDRERLGLRTVIESAAHQLQVLGEKKKKDEDGSAADLSDFEKVREMSQRGMASNIRISESRRAALMSSTQLLHTVVEINNIERQKHEYGMQLERFESQRRVELLKELQDTNVRIAQMTARLRSVGEKLLYSGALVSQLIGGSSGKPEFSVSRSGATLSGSATEDTKLLPGDTVAVTLHAGIPLADLARSH